MENTLILLSLLLCSVALGQDTTKDNSASRSSRGLYDFYSIFIEPRLVELEETTEKMSTSIDAQKQDLLHLKSLLYRILTEEKLIRRKMRKIDRSHMMLSIKEFRYISLTYSSSLPSHHLPYPSQILLLPLLILYFICYRNASDCFSTARQRRRTVIFKDPFSNFPDVTREADPED